MKVYVVWNSKREWFELYSLKPQWDQEEEYWFGKGFIEILDESELVDSIVHEAKDCGNVVPCHADIKVMYAYVS